MPSFDTFPIAHTVPALLLCIALLGWQLMWPERRPQWFLPAVLLLFLFLRLPSIWYNNEINPDESQMITQGRTLAHDPVYFRSVDGTTIGPLDSYALIIPSWFGLPFDYSTARLLGFVLIAFSLVFLYKAAYRWFGERPARLALLPMVFTLGLTQNGDLLSYCSELVPLFLLSMGTWLLTRIDNRQQTPYILLVIGLLIGMVPLGKLQGAPLAAVLGLFVVVSVIRQPIPRRLRYRQLALLVIGTIAFPLAFILSAWSHGLYRDFWMFYIEGNLRYGGNTDHWATLMRFSQHMGKGDEFGWLMIYTTALMTLATIRYTLIGERPLGPGRWMARLGFVGLSMLAGLYTITRTGTEFVHYFYFLSGPLFMLLALSWKMLLVQQSEPAQRLVPALASVLLVLPLLASSGYLALFVGQGALNYARHVPLNPYPSDGKDAFAIAQPPIVRQIRKYAHEGEQLVIWGWRCDYYVGAQMQQGVAENHSERCVFQSPMTAIYQKRYLNNFVRSFPPVFVDAVGSQNAWLTDRQTQGHEIIKPLADFIRTHYQYIGLANDARIYVRFDRLNGKPTKQQSYVE